MAPKDRFFNLIGGRKGIIFVTVLALGTFIVTLALFLNWRTGVDQAEAEASLSGRTKEEEQELQTSDFILAVPDLINLDPQYYPLRPRIKVWSQVLVDKYWVPVPKILLDIVSKKNDKSVEEILGRIP